MLYAETLFKFVISFWWLVLVLAPSSKSSIMWGWPYSLYRLADCFLCDFTSYPYLIKDKQHLVMKKGKTWGILYHRWCQVLFAGFTCGTLCYHRVSVCICVCVGGFGSYQSGAQPWDFAVSCSLWVSWLKACGSEGSFNLCLCLFSSQWFSLELPFSLVQHEPAKASFKQPNSDPTLSPKTASL